MNKRINIPKYTSISVFYTKKKRKKKKRISQLKEEKHNCTTYDHVSIFRKIKEKKRNSTAYQFSERSKKNATVQLMITYQFSDRSKKNKTQQYNL